MPTPKLSSDCFTLRKFSGGCHAVKVSLGLLFSARW